MLSATRWRPLTVVFCLILFAVLPFYDRASYSVLASANSEDGVISTDKVDNISTKILKQAPSSLPDDVDVGECILVFAAFCNGNLGDVVQAASMRHLISRLTPSHEETCVWYAHPAKEDPANGFREGEFFGSDFSRLLSLRCDVESGRQVSRFKGLVIGGGGLLEAPHWPLGCQDFVDGIGDETPVAIFGVGASEEALRSAPIVRRAGYVSGRDNKSVTSLSAALGMIGNTSTKPDEVRAVRDPVLSDEYYTDVEGKCWNDQSHTKRKPVCFVLPSALKENLQAIHRVFSTEVVREGDILFNLFPKHQAEIEAFNYTVPVEAVLDPSTFMRRLCGCVAVVSSRLHGAILGLHSGVPTFAAWPAAEGNKLPGLMNDVVNLPDQFLHVDDSLTREQLDARVTSLRIAYGKYGSRRRELVFARLRDIYRNSQMEGHRLLSDLFRMSLPEFSDTAGVSRAGGFWREQIFEVVAEEDAIKALDIGIAEEEKSRKKGLKDRRRERKKDKEKMKDAGTSHVAGKTETEPDQETPSTGENESPTLSIVQDGPEPHTVVAVADQSGSAASNPETDAVETIRDAGTDSRAEDIVPYTEGQTGAASPDAYVASMFAPPISAQESDNAPAAAQDGGDASVADSLLQEMEGFVENSSDAEAEGSIAAKVETDILSGETRKGEQQEGEKTWADVEDDTRADQSSPLLLWSVTSNPLPEEDVQKVTRDIESRDNQEGTGGDEVTVILRGDTAREQDGSRRVNPVPSYSEKLSPGGARKGWREPGGTRHEPSSDEHEAAFGGSVVFTTGTLVLISLLGLPAFLSLGKGETSLTPQESFPLADEEGAAGFRAAATAAVGSTRWRFRSHRLSKFVFFGINYALWVALAMGFNVCSKTYLRKTQNPVALLAIQGWMGIGVLCARNTLTRRLRGSNSSPSPSHSSPSGSASPTCADRCGIRQAKGVERKVWYAGLLHCCNAVLMSWSVLIGGVAATHALKALEPVAAAGFSRWLLGSRLPPGRAAAVAVIVLGLGISMLPAHLPRWAGGARGEKPAESIGDAELQLVIPAMITACACCAVALRNVLVKGASPSPPSPPLALMVCSIVVAGIGTVALLLPWMPCSWEWAGQPLLLASGVNASLCFVGYNLASFNLLSELSPVGHAVGNASKRVCLFATGLLLGESGSMSARQLAGASVAFVGLASYNLAGVSA